MTDVIRVDPQHPAAADINRAAALLRRGGLVAFPTETVYGLGAHALDRAAVRRVFEAKGRPSTDPLIVHVRSIGDVAPLVRAVPEALHALAARYWPGPLTVVLPRSAVVPNEVTAGLDTVAIRVPAHAVALALIEAAGLPIAAPSANLFSRPSPTRAEHVLQDLEGRIDAVVDGGATIVGVESTVLDLTSTPPVILRPGAVTLDMLRAIIPRVALGEPAAVPAGQAMPSPGLLARHYAPRAPLTLYLGAPAGVIARIRADAREAAARGSRVGIIAADEDQFDDRSLTVVRVGAADDLNAIASRLYAALRELDAAGVDEIMARGFPDTAGLGVAIADRLRRAAARTVHVSS